MPADDAAEQEPEKDSWGTVGFRAFGGVLAAEGSSYGLLGAGFLMGVPVWRSLELEGSVAWAGRFDSGGFVVTELMAKWVFETDGKLAPHVTLGPLLSVDIDREATFAGGLVAGGGASWWLDRRWGLVADVNYRLLAGSVVEHVVTGALGVSYRF
ncbi:MAG TPA: hypothetical protein VLC09_18735 [Polyangiaceae bacterium]|nr:hypothetical protein [Polyangiaceae bacterium]